MKSNIAAAAAVAGLLASSTLASPVPSQSGWSADADKINKKIDAPFKHKPGSSQSIDNLKSKIKNVVWVLLENRSFDNILGGIKHPGLDNPINNGPFCIPQDVNDPDGKQWCTGSKDFDSVENDPDHTVTGNNYEFFGEFAPNNEDVASGKLKTNNRGFVHKQLLSHPNISAEIAAKQVLNYYTEEQVPVMKTLVEEFITFNYWFSCVPGPTNPNRLCAVAGTSAGHGTNDQDFNTSAIDINNVFEEISKKDISWLNYDGTNGEFLPDSLFFKWTAENAPGNVVPIENFFQDAYLGQLPQLSYLNPSCCGANSNSMHPNGNVSYGEIFVKQIYEAVRNGPQWEDTLLLLTYDESGGFFDHVPSPAAVRPDDKTYTETAEDGSEYTLLFDRLGGRMPTFLISPYTPEGYVENYGVNPETGKSEPYSATSVLKTLGYLWDIEDLTPRVANSPSFDHLIGTVPRWKLNQLPVPKTF